MSVAFDAWNDGGNNTVSSTIVTVAGTTDVYCGVIVYGATGSHSSGDVTAKLDGVAMTLVTTKLNASTGSVFSIWMFVTTGVSSGSHTATATKVAGVFTDIEVMTISFSGTGSPFYTDFGTAAVHTAANSVATLSLTTTVQPALLLAFVAEENNHALGSGSTTVLGTNNFAFNIAYNATNYSSTGTQSVTVVDSNTGVADDWIAVLVGVQSGGAAPVSLPYRSLLGVGI